MIGSLLVLILGSPSCVLKWPWERYWTPSCSWWAAGTLHGSLCHQYERVNVTTVCKVCRLEKWYRNASPYTMLTSSLAYRNSTNVFQTCDTNWDLVFSFSLNITKEFQCPNQTVIISKTRNKGATNVWSPIAYCIRTYLICSCTLSCVVLRFIDVWRNIVHTKPIAFVFYRKRWFLLHADVTNLKNTPSISPLHQLHSLQACCGRMFANDMLVFFSFFYSLLRHIIGTLCPILLCSFLLVLFL